MRAGENEEKQTWVERGKVYEEKNAERKLG
jgi:hypothetical protein